MTPQALLAELERLNVKIFLAGDKLRINAPAGVLTPAHKEAITKHKDELVNHLTQWNEPTALSLIHEAVERIRRWYPADAWPWAAENRPDLRQAVKDAEAQYNRAFHQGDMAGCRRAAAGYERAFDELISTYNQQRVLTPDETITAFGCDRAWNLPPGKVAVLDAVFQKEGVRWDD
jgi:hypothetical protein